MSTLTFLEDIRLSMDVGDKTQLLAPPTEPSPPPAKTPTMGPVAKGQEARPPATPAAAEDRSELWRIDLVGNVDARQADQKITCQHLSLFNRSSRGATSPARRRPGQGQGPDRPAQEGRATGRRAANWWSSPTGR